jgi:UDP-N-acetylglucosamine 2-epimerase (non-hydrolysing)
LEKNAKLVLTDSGGVQEECCIVKTPCITLRDNTERPETVTVKANIVSGTNPQNIIKCANKMLKSKQSWLNPFGNGNTSKKIVDVMRSNL